jgi:hypothetical protein
MTLTMTVTVTMTMTMVVVMIVHRWAGAAVVAGATLAVVIIIPNRLGSVSLRHMTVTMTMIMTLLDNSAGAVVAGATIAFVVVVSDRFGARPKSATVSVTMAMTMIMAMVVHSAGAATGATLAFAGRGMLHSRAIIVTVTHVNSWTMVAARAFIFLGNHFLLRIHRGVIMIVVVIAGSLNSLGGMITTGAIVLLRNKSRCR